MVLWKSSFLYFGGDYNPTSVLKFNFLTQNWEIVASQSAPFYIVLSDCTLFPNDKISIVSNTGQALFNPKTNARSDTRYGTTFVTLSGRVFDLGAQYPSFTPYDTEEYDFISNTWIPVDVQLIGPPNSFTSAIALPAKLFEQLPGGCVGV